MEWDQFLSTLTHDARQQAHSLAEQYGHESVTHRINHFPFTEIQQLSTDLQRTRNQIRSRVPGLYESIDLNHQPSGWTIANTKKNSSDGTSSATMSLVGPNGGKGFFERAYNSSTNTLELRNAFLVLRGQTTRLPAWVEDVSVPLVPGRGTATVLYFTLYQFKLLDVPASGAVTLLKMSTIQNIESILHLHWLRTCYPNRNLNELIRFTNSVEYAETVAVQFGYVVQEVRYSPADVYDSPIGELMTYFEKGNPSRIAENDGLLRKYNFDRTTSMLQNFNIELSLRTEGSLP